MAPKRKTPAAAPPAKKGKAEKGPCKDVGPCKDFKPTKKDDEKFMRMAIDKMREAGVVKKTGGPFGAVIVDKSGVVLACSGNSVLKDKDPSAHAEVNAIRQACKKIGSHDLAGCTLYTSCECCPMCYSTAYWAGIRKVFYAASWSDYDDIFSDRAISEDIKKEYKDREIPLKQILHKEAAQVWQEFRKMPDGARY